MDWEHWGSIPHTQHPVQPPSITITAQVIPPKGWYPEQPKTAEEVEALFEKLHLMVPPIKQFVSGARGAYSLALKDTKKVGDLFFFLNI